MWLSVDGRIQISMEEFGKELNVQVQDRWVPIHPKVGVEYAEVLNDVVSQIKTIAKIVGAHLPAQVPAGGIPAEQR